MSSLPDRMGSPRRSVWREPWYIVLLAVHIPAGCFGFALGGFIAGGDWSMLLLCLYAGRQWTRNIR